MKKTIQERKEISLYRSSGLFDGEWYLNEYPDVKAANVDPLEHYYFFGESELRSPSSFFSPRYYLETYPDVKNAGIKPLLHYIQHGKQEGRSGGGTGMAFKRIVGRKIKVLFLIPGLHIAGSEKSLADLVKYLDKSIFDLTVMTLVDYGDLREEVKKYATYKSAYLSDIIIADYPQAAKEMITEDYDIEVAFNEVTPTPLIAYSPNKNAKKIAWVHRDFSTCSLTEWVYKDLEERRFCYSRFNDIVFVSNGTKLGFEKKISVDSKKHVVYNIVDRAAILAKANEAIPLQKEKFTIVTIGHMGDDGKGYRRLLEVHRKLILAGYDYMLWIIGDGIFKEEHMAFVNNHHLERNTVFFGFQENPYPILKKADLYLCSSYSESFSYATAEALLLGIPVLTTDCVGPRELLQDGKLGLIVENTEAGLENGLRRLVGDRNLYNYYLNIARTNRYFHYFSPEEIAKKVGAIFQGD